MQFGVHESYTKYREKMPCKGICIRYKASGRYTTGNKRCHQCNLFIKWEKTMVSLLRVQIKNQAKEFQQGKVKKSKTNGASQRSKNIISQYAKLIVNRSILFKLRGESNPQLVFMQVVDIRGCGIGTKSLYEDICKGDIAQNIMIFNDFRRFANSSILHNIQFTINQTAGLRLSMDKMLLIWLLLTEFMSLWCLQSVVVSFFLQGQ